jgi:hypothetical protein
LRDGQTLTFRIQPVLAKTEDPNEQKYRIGFQNSRPEMKVISCRSARRLSHSLAENRKDSALILQLIKKLLAAQGFAAHHFRPDRHRARRRRGGAAKGLDAAARVDGGHQPESRHL